VHETREEKTEYTRLFLKNLFLKQGGSIMKNIMSMQRLVLLPAIAFMLAGYGCTQSEYKYQYLLPPGWEYAGADAINDNGVVVGHGYDGTKHMGFIYDNGKYTKLLPPGWIEASAVDINNNGVVVGKGILGSTDSSGIRGFVYSEGKYTELLPPGWLNASATAINNNGVVVGYGAGYCCPYVSGGFIYKNGEYTELLLPGEWVSAIDINDSGVVIVGRSDATGQGGFFIYYAGEYTELLPPGWTEAYAVAINNNGVVVGYGEGGFMYKDGEYTELLPPERLYVSGTTAINDNGVVTGNIRFDGFVCKDGEYTELLPPGYWDAHPKSINNEGVVAGVVYSVIRFRGITIRPSHGFIATPRIIKE
jgi:uncharacterized membrane protein